VALLAWGGYEGGRYLLARSNLDAACKAAEQRDWASSQTYITASLRYWPANPDAHLVQARIYRRCERFDAAERHLQQCQLLLGCETHPIKVERTLIRAQRGELNAVEPLLRTWIRQADANSVEILDILSDALLQDGQVVEAQRCLDALLQRRPNDFEALVRRGRTAESKTWMAEAVAFHERALALRPAEDQLRLNLAENQVALGRFAEARPHFEHLLQCQPQNPAARFGLARCLAGENSKQQAIRLLDSLLAEHPNDWMALAERGWLAVELDDAATGEPLLRRAANRVPRNLTVIVRLADCLRVLGKEDEANVLRERVEQLQAEEARASELANLIREKEPNDPDLRCELGCTLLHMGRQQEALRCFKTALEKDPEHRKTHEALVEFYESVRDYAQAAKHRRIPR
jgi:tetratricopeptide (TPR) repeat protein